MRRFLSIVFILAALPASAQTNVNVGGTGCTGGENKQSTAEQDLLTPTARALDNAGICLSHGLAKTCTQAQLDAVPGCAAGVCGTIYAGTVSGARLYALDRMFEGYFSLVGNKVQALNLQDIAAQAQINGSTVAAAGECSDAGLSAGCTRFQLACRYLTGSTSGVDCKP